MVRCPWYEPCSVEGVLRALHVWASPVDFTDLRRSLSASFPPLLLVRDPSCAGAASGGIVRAKGAVLLPALHWLHPAFDPSDLDAPTEAAAAAGEFSVAIAGPVKAARLSGVLSQVATRCQRFLHWRNAYSACPLFERILEGHRRLHDTQKPLVQADYRHAVDTWLWVLRLAREASMAVQIAALFHDIERLLSESDRRVEQHARDYLAFKKAHAASGAELTRQVLLDLGADAALSRTVAALVSGHECPSSDPDAALLNEADALSFFSLNSSGFFEYFGREHTISKVDYTVRRLGKRGRRIALSLKYRPEVATLLQHALGGSETSGGEESQR